MFNVGDLIRCLATFTNYQKDLVDPTTVTFKMRLPDSSFVTYVYGSNVELVKQSTGVYYVDFPITQDGKHAFGYYSTGTGQAASEANFAVKKSIVNY
jgi:hypothetical protein